LSIAKVRTKEGLKLHHATGTRFIVDDTDTTLEYAVVGGECLGEYPFLLIFILSQFMLFYRRTIYSYYVEYFVGIKVNGKIYGMFTLFKHILSSR